MARALRAVFLFHTPHSISVALFSVLVFRLRKANKLGIDEQVIQICSILMCPDKVRTVVNTNSVEQNVDTHQRQQQRR